jgi:hypothetical protein
VTLRQNCAVAPDAPDAPARDPGRVNVPERVRVVLEIERTDRAISGQLVADGAGAIDFYGWLELIDGIERLASSGAAVRDASGQEPKRGA